MNLIQSFDNIEVWEIEDKPVIFQHTSNRPGGNAQFPGSVQAAEAVAWALQEFKVVYNFHGMPLICDGGEWKRVQTVPEMQIVLFRHIVFARRWDDDEEEEELGFHGSAYTAPNLRSMVARLPRTRVFDTVPRGLAQLLLAAGFLNYPKLQGLISHPIVDCPPAWRPRETYDIPCASKFHHLPKLASAFNLDPASHAMYYMYLLGAFHGVSLTTQRPILLIDSWQGSRGKTQLSQTISILCDNSQEAMVASGDRQHMEDKIISHLVKGRRSVVMGNIDRRREFTHPTLIALATDGDLTGRAKYDREASTYRGILVVANLIFGAASLHEDFLSRTWRVELRGPSTVLDPPPNEYALEHREEIISEILLAHAEAIRYTEPVCTRFEHFERKAAGAYCRAFSLSPEQTHARIRLAIVGSLSFRTQAIQSLARARESAFSPAAFETLTRDFTRVTGVDLPKTFIGATALGYTFNGKDWIQNGSYAGS